MLWLNGGIGGNTNWQLASGNWQLATWTEYTTGIRLRNWNLFSHIPDAGWHQECS